MNAITNHIEYTGFISNASLQELKEIAEALTDAIQEQDGREGADQLYEAWTRAGDCAAFLQQAIEVRKHGG